MTKQSEQNAPWPEFERIDSPLKAMRKSLAARTIELEFPIC